MIGAITLGHSSNESGCRTLCLCAIRLASGSMVTLPAHAEPDLIDPRFWILIELPTLCLSSHRSISFLSYKQRHPIRTRGTSEATCRSKVRSETRQYRAASSLVSRGDSRADVSIILDPPGGERTPAASLRAAARSWEIRLRPGSLSPVRVSAYAAAATQGAVLEER